MIKLYGHEISGNSHKACLMLSLLNLEYEWIKTRTWLELEHPIKLLGVGHGESN